MKKHVSKPYIFISLALCLLIIGTILHGIVYSFIRDNVIPASPLTGTVLTPSVNNADFYSTEAYGGPDSPWGFYHNGIDFLEYTNHQPIQAAADGKVVRLVEQFNAGSKWQIELTIKHGPYDLQYAFEIFSSSKQDIDAQFADITVKLGQYVHRGQIIGNLHRINEGAHVHFGITKNNQVACPEPFFTAQARADVLTIIRKTYPGANMCYPADPTAPRKTPVNNVQTNILTR